MRSLNFVLVVLAVATTAAAQEPSVPHIRVSGDATLDVEPDQAEIDLGVVTQGRTAQEASEANATKLDAVLQAMRGVAGTNAEIETTNYSLQPNYQRARDGGEATIMSYTATNIVRASAVAIDKTGELIDAAIGAGANNVQRLNFTVEDAQTHRDRALDAAAKQARAKAETLAGALDLQILGVLSVTEGADSIVQPYTPRMAMMQAEAAPATPIEAGSVEIRASITLVVAVGTRQ